MCDHEPYADKLWREGAAPGDLNSVLHDGDRRHAAFMNHADLVIHDAQYTPEEYPAKKNWGHSTYEYAVELAAMSDVHRLVLTHHDPTHDDNFLDDIQHRARNFARRRDFLMQVMCAYEGMEIEVLAPHSDRVRTIDIAPSVPVETEKTKVLIVDDDPNLRLLATASLKRDGYEIYEAANGLEGLKRFHEIAPDIVVLDLNMPVLDGIEMLKQLRSSNRGPDTPVLILTAEGDESNTARAFDAGATDYLAKPFTPPQLSARIRACLGRIRAVATAAFA